MTKDTDRDLLEKAAKVAGIDIKPHGNNKTSRDLLFTYKGQNWNPLTNDGDALRLLTKLPYRELYCSEIGATVSWRRADGSGHGFKCDEYASEHNGDLNAATRLAIVRAAAVIGEAMPDIRARGNT